MEDVYFCNNCGQGIWNDMAIFCACDSDYSAECNHQDVAWCSNECQEEDRIAGAGDYADYYEEEKIWKLDRATKTV